MLEGKALKILTALGLLLYFGILILNFISLGLSYFHVLSYGLHQI
jgi:hypothetical protein